MTGSLCTLWIRLLGSEPNLQLFTEGGGASKEACLYFGMGLLAAGKLSPQPQSARHCINTGERQGSYRKKLYGEAGGCSWGFAAQSCTLYPMDQMFHQKASQTSSRQTSQSWCQIFLMATVFEVRNIWPWELIEGNFRTSSRPKAVVPKLYLFTPRDLELCGVVSSALQLTWIHFTHEAQLCFVRTVVEPRGCWCWFMALRCRSQVQTCQGVQVCLSPSPGLPAAGSP